MTAVLAHPDQKDIASRIAKLNVSVSHSHVDCDFRVCDQLDLVVLPLHRLAALQPKFTKRIEDEDVSVRKESRMRRGLVVIVCGAFSSGGSDDSVGGSSVVGGGGSMPVVVGGAGTTFNNSIWLETAMNELCFQSFFSRWTVFCVGGESEVASLVADCVRWYRTRPVPVGLGSAAVKKRDPKKFLGPGESSSVGKVVGAPAPAEGTSQVVAEHQRSTVVGDGEAEINHAVAEDQGQQAASSSGQQGSSSQQAASSSVGVASPPPEEAGGPSSSPSSGSEEPLDLREEWLLRDHDVLSAGLPKTDATRLLATFGRLINVLQASKEDLARVPGFGTSKINRFWSVFHERIMEVE